jgi:hypothetical protein
VDCPGAVSLSASKEVLKFAQSIVVDLSETAALPDPVKQKYEAGGASVPIVIFTDPGISQTFGRFDYPAMKSQEFTKIFKTARERIQAAKDDGTFSAKETTMVEVNGSEIETWKSAAGTEIKAKLVGIEDDSVYLFETEAGKTIRATAKQLDAESVAKARKLAKLDE